MLTLQSEIQARISPNQKFFVRSVSRPKNAGQAILRRSFLVSTCGHQALARSSAFGSAPSEKSAGMSLKQIRMGRGDCGGSLDERRDSGHMCLGECRLSLRKIIGDRLCMRLNSIAQSEAKGFNEIFGIGMPFGQTCRLCAEKLRTYISS